jgi:hypothetical protein
MEAGDESISEEEVGKLADGKLGEKSRIVG